MLTTKQKKFITEFLKSGQVGTTCTKVKISKTTYYDWLKNEEFAAELKKQQAAIYEEGLNKLRKLFNKAIDVYESLLKSEDESIKFRTAKAIVDDTSKLIDSKEMQERIETLEENMKKESD